MASVVVVAESNEALGVRPTRSWFEVRFGAA